MNRLSALFLLGLFGCDGVGGPEGDRAGPPTTESSPPYAEWSVDSTPAVRIGALDGPPEYQFFQVAYAARLSDGRIVVFDGGSSELRWFGPDGRFHFRTGGRGEGPGEFQSVVSAAVTRLDTIVLYDVSAQRLTWFGPDGSLSRTRRTEVHRMMRLVPFGDTRLVIAEERPVLNLAGDEFNYAHDSILIMVTGGDSEALDTLLHRAGREAATWVQYTDGRPTASAQFPLPFSHPTLVGAAAGRIVTVESGGDQLSFMDEGGGLIGSARRTDVRPAPPTARMREEYVANAGRRARERGGVERLAEAAAESLLGLVPDGRAVSPFDRMMTDAVSDRIWLRDHLFEWEADEAQRWTVHDATGRVLARVSTPAGFDVMQVGPEHLVGVERDELDVEYVVVYSLRGSGMQPGWK